MYDTINAGMGVPTNAILINQGLGLSLSSGGHGGRRSGKRAEETGEDGGNGGGIDW